MNAARRFTLSKSPRRSREQSPGRRFQPGSESLPGRELLAGGINVAISASVGADVAASSTNTPASQDSPASNATVSSFSLAPGVTGSGTVMTPPDVTIEVSDDNGNTGQDDGDGGMVVGSYASGRLVASYRPFSVDPTGMNPCPDRTLSPIVLGGQSVIVTLKSSATNSIKADIQVVPGKLATWTLSPQGSLVVTGTDGDDTISISQEWNFGFYTVIQQTIASGQTYTIGVVDASKVGLIEVDALGGNDTVEIGPNYVIPINTPDLGVFYVEQRPSSVVVNGNGGDDTILYHGPTQGPADPGVMLYGNAGDDTIRVDGPLDSGGIFGGGGSDTLDALDATLTNFTIDPGAYVSGAPDGSVDTLYIPKAYDSMIVHFGDNDVKKRKR